MNKNTAKIESIVRVHHGQPFTNTLAIAVGVGLEHQFVIRLVRKYKTDFEEFGPFDFQSRKGEKLPQGGFAKATEFAELNEDQATYLITLFKNTETVRAFKIRLVKAFRKALKELERLRKQANEPDWKLIRDETRVGFKWMNETLQEKRAVIGKKTDWRHYSNEARMINAVLTNRFSGLDRNTLSASDLQLIADLQRCNAMLIAQDMPYLGRKAILMDRAARKLTVHAPPLLNSDAATAARP